MICQQPQQIKNGEHAQYFALLELFAFGSWADYKGMVTDIAWATAMRPQPPQHSQQGTIPIPERRPN